MQFFDPQKLSAWSGGSWVGELPASINGFCFDARQIQPGQCFVALSGGTRDGHDFIEQAAKGGAVAALVEQAQELNLPQLQVTDSLVALGMIAAAVRRKFTQPVVAVTGSCGKTSTKEMLRCILGDTCHATAGNWNNLIGVPMTLFGLDPSCQDFAVIEAGINQRGEMAALGQMIRADLNVLTNIGAAHLELLGSKANIATEKSLLAQYAAEGSPIILPAEVLGYPAYAALADRAIVLLPEGEPVPALPVRKMVRYKVVEQTLCLGRLSYAIASPSHGMATNAALAIVSARELGIAEADIRQRIEAWRPVGNRGRIATLGAQTFYIDCYNANPSSMVDALDAFDRSTLQDVPCFYILGAMNELGESAAEQHAAIGRLLSLRPQDRAAFIGPEDLTLAYENGALSEEVAVEQLERAVNVEKIKSTVAQFKGAIFLKGSRSYQLEKLLPEAIR